MKISPIETASKKTNQMQIIPKKTTSASIKTATKNPTQKNGPNEKKQMKTGQKIIAQMKTAPKKTTQPSIKTVLKKPIQINIAQIKKDKNRPKDNDHKEDKSSSNVKFPKNINLMKTTQMKQAQMETAQKITV